MGTAGRRIDQLKRLLGHDTPGEFVDRVQILQLKASRLTDAEKKRATARRRDELEVVLEGLRQFAEDRERLRQVEERLSLANAALWGLEDEIRQVSSQLVERPEDMFLLRRHARIATGIHRWNDQRSRIKREIDKIFKWPHSEVKGFDRVTPGADDE